MMLRARDKLRGQKMAFVCRVDWLLFVSENIYTQDRCCAENDVFRRSTFKIASELTFPNNKKKKCFRHGQELHLHGC